MKLSERIIMSLAVIASSVVVILNAGNSPADNVGPHGNDDYRVVDMESNIQYCWDERYVHPDNKVGCLEQARKNWR